MLDLNRYKGYVAKLEIDLEEDVIRGRVLNISDEGAHKGTALSINDLITFEGRTVREAQQNFHRAVDDYLQFCQEQGIEPNKPFSGKLPFRTSPELHSAIYQAANRAGKSINAWMEEVLSEAAQHTHVPRKGSSKLPTKAEISVEDYQQFYRELEQKIDQLQAVTVPYLKEKPESFPQFLAAIEPFLRDRELPDLIEKLDEVKLIQVKEAPLQALAYKEARKARANVPCSAEANPVLEKSSR